MSLLINLKQLPETLNIQQKGLLLISIPLAFQVLFTLSIGTLYSQVEKAAQKEAQARVVATRVNTLVKDIWDISELGMAYSMTRDKEALKKFNTRRSTIIDTLDSLKNFSVDNPEFAKSYGTMQIFSNKTISILDKIMKSVDENMGTPDLFSDVKPFMVALEKDAERAITLDVQQQSRNLIEEERSRKGIANILYASVIADFVIAFFLSVFFASSIAGRLSVISDNTLKAKAKTALNPEIAGSDEIANLDKQFHSLVAALNDSERLRSEFLAMTSHDLKTPLMSVELSLELISRQISSSADSAPLNTELVAAKENMLRVLTLINDLLDLERGASGKLNLELEDLRIDFAIEKSCRSVAPLADRKNITLQHQKQTDDADVLADRRRIEQVLVNLIANAVKFSPDNSTVQISSKRVGNELEIRISDRAGGIAEADRERIFERFEQAGPNPSGKDAGSGLGLAICKTIVHAHNGSIGVDAVADGGSEFWFRLPIVDS